MGLFQQFPISFIQTFGLSTFCSIDVLKRIENCWQYYWFCVMQYPFKHILLFKDFNFAESCPILLLCSLFNCSIISFIQAFWIIYLHYHFQWIKSTGYNRSFKMHYTLKMADTVTNLGSSNTFLSRKRQQAHSSIQKMKSYLCWNSKSSTYLSC